MSKHEGFAGLPTQLQATGITPGQPSATEEPLCIINSEAMDKETVEIVTSWQPPATGLVKRWAHKNGTPLLAEWFPMAGKSYYAAADVDAVLDGVAECAEALKHRSSAGYDRLWSICAIDTPWWHANPGGTFVHWVADRLAQLRGGGA